MDRILVMRSFVTVAKIGSFSGAAKQLGTSGSLISRHVADLEKQLGVHLVNRTARSVSLTEPGQRYSEFAQRILDEIDEEDSRIAELHDRPEGPLSIICPKWIGGLDLGDAIAEFSVAHPKIAVRFELGGMSDRTYDFLDSGFDVAFHTRDLRDSSVRLKRIASLPFVLCAADSYIEKHGLLTDPNALSDHDCLVHVNDPVWRIGHGHSSTLHKIRNIGFQSNSYIALHKAAVHGRGIALLPTRSAYDDLVDGKLRVLLPELPVPSRSLYAIYGPAPQAPRKVEVFLGYLTKWFAENPLPVFERSLQ
ncbi:DNA-binding transcriptional LysR family regulator [Actinoplanes lutulentus]|uniref:DNA-binding transcriptional LysR family regulator n=1 Tax=Actinoplanes lutulentus TaxID=1287878 RepID=A0A327ZLF1_9ACTN|nr:LysR family transcriptional regulator [Actinoplanes lutulentus]MBB2943941.1 DNA-binding transcriptional LysR family regulator [Actinoplanes lutulentus]RAK42826.1 DNA-binding transcriptional LysR family regulator [Actinoplanes lutulentus]